MKTFFFAAIICLSMSAAAQNCKNYYYMQKDKTIEMTIYDKKGNAAGRQVYLVSDVTNGGNAVTANVQTEMFDKKGRSLAKGLSSMKCENGIMLIDMKMVIPQQQAGPMSQADVKAENIYLEYPANMNPGDKLKDGNMAMDMNNNGLKSSMTMNITNRKVEAKESVTTTAGTWDCYKISYKGKMSMKIIGINKNIDIEGQEWFAPDFGIVKTSSQHGATAITAIK